MVDIGGAGDPAIAQPIKFAKLSKDTDVVGDPRVQVQQQPLQQVNVARGRLQSEVGVAVGFKTFTHLAANTQIAGPKSAVTNGDVFQLVPEVRGPIRIGPENRVIVVTQGMIDRIAWLWAGRACGATQQREKHGGQ